MATKIQELFQFVSEKSVSVNKIKKHVFQFKKAVKINMDFISKLILIFKLIKLIIKTK